MEASECSKTLPNIVVLTGAGVSAESGITTFRGADGLWHNHRMEELATPEAFAADPVLVHRFYNSRRKQLVFEGVCENQAHRALARLQKKYSGRFLLVTQNVDNLHERAGHQDVIHMHGELLKIRCTHCDTVQHCQNDVTVNSECSNCHSSGFLRPDIVWFGEIPRELEVIYAALETCDLFVAIGTSGVVYPAAGFVQVAQAAGASTLELNLEASGKHSIFSDKRYGPATETVPHWVEEILSL